MSKGCSSTLGLGRVTPFPVMSLGMFDGEASLAVGGDLDLADDVIKIKLGQVNIAQTCIQFYILEYSGITEHLPGIELLSHNILQFRLIIFLLKKTS